MLLLRRGRQTGRHGRRHGHGRIRVPRPARRAGPGRGRSPGAGVRADARQAAHPPGAARRRSPPPTDRGGHRRHDRPGRRERGGERVRPGDPRRRHLLLSTTRRGPHAAREPAGHDRGAGRGDRRRLLGHRPRVLHRRAAAPRRDARPPQSAGHRAGPVHAEQGAVGAAARERQDDGARSPSSTRWILGPHDPYMGESNATIRDILRGRLPTWPRGRLQWVDVRDTADVVIAALGRRGRYLVPGENVALPHEALRTVTGRRLPAVRLPLAAALPVVHLGYRTGWPLLPHAVEGSRIIAMNARVDHSVTVDELGIRGTIPRSISRATQSAGWPRPVTSPPVPPAGASSPEPAGRVPQVSLVAAGPRRETRPWTAPRSTPTWRASSPPSR